MYTKMFIYLSIFYILCHILCPKSMFNTVLPKRTISMFMVIWASPECRCGYCEAVINIVRAKTPEGKTMYVCFP